MGPFNTSKQKQRKKSLEKVLKIKTLPEDMRIIWQRHLNNLAVNEDEYNARVKLIYSPLRPKHKEWNVYA